MGPVHKQKVYNSCYMSLHRKLHTAAPPLSLCRGMFTLGTVLPLPATRFPIPKLNLTGRAPPKCVKGCFSAYRRCFYSHLCCGGGGSRKPRKSSFSVYVLPLANPLLKWGGSSKQGRAGCSKPGRVRSSKPGRTGSSKPGRGGYSKLGRLLSSVSIVCSHLSFCLYGRNTSISFDRITVPEGMSTWPSFHNGVAAGLRITPNLSKVGGTIRYTLG